MCVKSSLSTQHICQSVINVLSPLSSARMANQFFHSFSAVLATMKESAVVLTQIEGIK